MMRAVAASGAIAISLFLCGAGTSAQTPPVSDAETAIEEMLSRWERAYERRDPDALAAIFTENGIYAANTGEVLRGRADIRRGVSAWMTAPPAVAQARAGAEIDLRRTSLRFAETEGAAYAVMRFTIGLNPPGCLIDAGHALAVWRRQESGAWLLDALAVNQDRSPPPNACARPQPN